MKLKELEQTKQFKNAVEQLKQVLEKRKYTLAYDLVGDKIEIRIFEKLSEQEIEKRVERTIIG